MAALCDGEKPQTLFIYHLKLKEQRFRSTRYNYRRVVGLLKGWNVRSAKIMTSLRKFGDSLLFVLMISSFYSCIDVEQLRFRSTCFVSGWSTADLQLNLLLTWTRSWPWSWFVLNLVLTIQVWPEVELLILVRSRTWNFIFGFDSNLSWT